MNFTEIDQIIEDKLEILQEEKYKLRIFKVELLLIIQSSSGVEETLQDIRSIGGVTVVTALDSTYRKGLDSYLSKVRVKFHPQKETTRAATFIEDHLLPVIRSSEIPGCTVVRLTSRPEQIG